MRDLFMASKLRSRSLRTFPFLSRGVTVRTMALDFRILGPLEVAAATGPIRLGGRKQRAVLAILLLHANRVVPVDQLAEDLYGEDAPATAVAQVRDHVSQLRKLLGAPAVETQSPGYVLRIDPDQLDAARFERRVDDALEELAAGDATVAAAHLREALGLWRGPTLAEFTYDAFAQPEIGR